MTSTVALRASVTTVLLLISVSAPAQTSKFSTTNSRSQYVHWITLLDANKKEIDPADPNAPPYSPVTTCGKCHDYEAMSQGHHFNAMKPNVQNAMKPNVESGRRGEPWIWTHEKTGTRIPLSYRDWPGTYKPEALGISPWDFVLKFGRHMPGGGPGAGPAEAAGEEPAAEKKEEKEKEKGEAEPGRWNVAGRLDVDCLICHGEDRSYSPEVRAKHINAENFAWAATVAAGLAKIEGDVKRLPDDFDPSAAPEAEGKGPRLPKTVYYADKFNADNKVFFDVVRKPSNNACYYCHTVRPAGEEAAPTWTHDEDVHITAGLSCVDCHRNDVGHHTVRGYEQEQHPTGLPVAAFSCRGCHLGDAPIGGRFGAPKPLHKGLPPLHLEKLSCTSCHSGPLPTESARPIQTSFAHELGLLAHRKKDLPPGVVSPVFLLAGDVLYPYRMTWPAFWGVLKDDAVTLLNPDETHKKLRRVLRVRLSFNNDVPKVRLSSEDKVAVLGKERADVDESELTEDEKAKLEELIESKKPAAFLEKMTKAFETLAKDEIDGTPVYISGGKAYRLGSDGKAETFEHPAAEPYAWPLAHDVRPARQSLGVGGCVECHSDDAKILYGTVTAIGPAPDADPPTTVMHKLQNRDAELLAVWNQSFGGRAPFKWFSAVCLGAVVLILLLYLLIGVNGVFKLVRGKKTGGPSKTD